jgi:hypothetical protein
MNEVSAIVRAPERGHMTLTEVVNQTQLIKHILTEVMKEGTHFGTIPGTSKPSLWKPGAEKILSTFRIGITPLVTDLSTGDEIRYRVEAVARHASGQHLGSAFGEASSSEEKWKWRAAVCEEEWNEASPERRREKWVKGWQKSPPHKVKQVRTEPSDIANTVLKMAAKRAEIAVTLRVTAASDVFTQDLEDLPEELRGAIVEQEAAQIKQPERESATTATPAPAAPVAAVAPHPAIDGPPSAAPAGKTPIYLTNARIAKTGTKANGEPYSLYVLKDKAGNEHKSFRSTVYEAAQNAVELDAPVFLVTQTSPRGVTVEEIVAAGEDA